MVGIILASGMSKRFGSNKLLELINGKPMIYYVIKATKESLLKNIVVIYKDQEVKKICDEMKIKSIFNNKYELGQSESIKKGVKAYYNEDSFMFIMGDQPFLTYKTIDKLINKFNKSKNIIVPRYKNINGCPVIFPKEFKEDLISLSGDTGGRIIIKSNLSKVTFCYLNDEKELMDIDDKGTLKVLT